LWIYRDPNGYEGSTGALRLCENNPVHMLGDVALATSWEYTVVLNGWVGFWHKGGGLLGGQAKSFRRYEISPNAQGNLSARLTLFM
jgi:hypothetical protein